MSVTLRPPTTASDADIRDPVKTGEAAAWVEQNDTEPHRLDVPRVTGLIILSLIPFWSVPALHVLSNPSTATGFFHYELPYYVANGRAAFERGNGVLYPNPYDPAADAPTIYVHWLPWMLGWLTAKCGFDPGDVVLTFTFFASTAFAWATYRLVLLRTGSAGNHSTGFLLAMWGGGILCVAGIVSGLLKSGRWPDSLLQFDPGDGMWFLNWGRNALFPTEALYHTLTALCWIAEIRRRKAAASVCLLLLATTHPWSGLELLLTINLWRGIEYARERSPAARNQLSLSAVALVLFLAYYKVWLPSFPQHADLQNVWSLNWSLNWMSAGLAYLPVLVPCGILLRRRLLKTALNRTEQFLLCAVFVACGLAFHDRLIRPVQPLHFTRGYIWMPLFLLGLPVILKAWKSASRSSPQMVAIAMLLATVFVSDNLSFAAYHGHRQFILEDGFHLDVDERALLLQLQTNSDLAADTVMTDSETLNYLLPAYSHARPWLGHHFNTPDFPERRATWEHCFARNGVAVDQIPDAVNLIVVRRSRETANLARATAWSRVDLNNAGWLGWSRRTAALKQVSCGWQVFPRPAPE